MNNEQQIQRLLNLLKAETSISMRQKLIQTIATYGADALPALFDLMEVEANREVKSYILDMIAGIEKKGPPRISHSR
jgi:hypothetical protein